MGSAPVGTGIEIGVGPAGIRQRYYLLDAARTADADLPSGNLVSALVGLERARGTARLPEPLRVQVLIDLLRAQPDEELRQAFAAWLRQGLRLAGRLPEGPGDALAQLQEMHTMLEENVREWTCEWLEKGIEQGRAQGIEQGRVQGIEQGRAVLCRQAARKFDAAAGELLAAALAGVTDPDRLGRVGDRIIECATASELLARVRSDGPSGG